MNEAIRWIRQMLCILEITTVRCSRCGSVVTISDLEEYTYQCKECEEDLYAIETYRERRYL